MTKQNLPRTGIALLCRDADAYREQGDALPPAF